MSHAEEQRLNRIVETLGLKRSDLLQSSAETNRNRNLVIDGAPYEFERWASQEGNTARRSRLLKIAEILINSEKYRSHP